MATNELSDKINEAIMNQGMGFNASLVYLLKYGGEVYSDSFNIEISPENKRQLRDRLENIKQTYDVIKPRLSYVVNTIFGRKVRFMSPQKKTTKLKIRSFRELRKVLREGYQKYENKFEEPIDDITKKRLFDREQKLPENTHLELGYVEEFCLYGSRIKQTQPYLEKLALKWKKLSKKEKSCFPKFIAEAASNPYNYWEPKKHTEFYERYGKNLNEILIGDIAGFRMIEFDPVRAQITLKNLIDNVFSINLPGFRVIPETIDNHTKRLKDKRPGGVHFTIVDRGQTNFPIEVQYWPIESQIYDMFGPHAKDLYALRGKKKDQRYK